MNTKERAGIWAKAGAILYAGWGLLHVTGGGLLLRETLSDPAAAMRSMASGAPDAALAGAVSAVGASLLAYHTFNLVWLGALVTAVAVLGNWRNSGAAFWFNLALVGATDLGLVLTFLQPGHIPWAQGSLGLGLFLGALVCSTLGQLRGGALSTRLAGVTAV